MEKLVGPKELAQHLGVSVANLHQMRKRGQIPPAIFLTPQRLRWRLSDVDAWIAALPTR